jgi:Fe2+ transport system protein FeoA
MENTISQGLNQEERRLDDLKPGQSATVKRLELTGPQRRRLMDLGLLPGTVVTVAMDSPLGDPTAYRIREALIALRRDQARQIVIDSEDK